MENKDYVFAGNISEGGDVYKMIRDGPEMQNGRIRFGPAVDSETCEFNPRWRGMVGIYILDSPAGCSLAVKDKEGRKITLEQVMEKARLLPLAVRGGDGWNFWHGGNW